MKDKVIGVIADNLCINPELIEPELSLTDDLQADSLDVVEIGMALEEEFGIEIEEDEIQEMKTVNDAICLVERNLESGEDHE